MAAATLTATKATAEPELTSEQRLATRMKSLADVRRTFPEVDLSLRATAENLKTLSIYPELFHDSDDKVEARNAKALEMALEILNHLYVEKKQQEEEEEEAAADRESIVEKSSGDEAALEKERRNLAAMGMDAQGGKK